MQHENYVDRVTVRRQLNDSGFDTTEKEINLHYKEQVECLLVKEGFAERMKRYCEYRRRKENSSFVIHDDMMERQAPEVRIYYDRIGYDRIRTLGYKEKSLKNEMELIHHRDVVMTEFRNIFKPGMRLTTNRIKEMMNDVYARYGIKKKGVVTNL